MTSEPHDSELAKLIELSMRLRWEADRAAEVAREAADRSAEIVRTSRELIERSRRRGPWSSGGQDSQAG